MPLRVLDNARKSVLLCERAIIHDIIEKNIAVALRAYRFLRPYRGEYGREPPCDSVRTVVHAAVHVRREMGVVRTARNYRAVTRICGESAPRKRVQCGRATVRALHVQSEIPLHAYYDAGRIRFMSRRRGSGEKKYLPPLGSESGTYRRFEPEYGKVGVFGA